MVFSIERFHCIQDSQLGPNCVLYREVPLYIYNSIHVYIYYGDTYSLGDCATIGKLSILQASTEVR